MDGKSLTHTGDMQEHLPDDEQYYLKLSSMKL